MLGAWCKSRKTGSLVSGLSWRAPVKSLLCFRVLIHQPLDREGLAKSGAGTVQAGFQRLASGKVQFRHRKPDHKQAW